MTVDVDKAVRKDFDGETFYFCSQHCLHAFGVERAESTAVHVHG
jgi:YHS domain-containing protein